MPRWFNIFRKNFAPIGTILADKVRDLTAMSILIAGKQPIQSIITLTVVMDFFCGDYFVEVVGWVRIDWVRSVMVCQLKSERS